jgi:hypothetical protein
VGPRCVAFARIRRPLMSSWNEPLPPITHSVSCSSMLVLESSFTRRFNKCLFRSVAV